MPASLLVVRLEFGKALYGIPILKWLTNGRLLLSELVTALSLHCGKEDKYAIKQKMILDQ